MWGELRRNRHPRLYQTERRAGGPGSGNCGGRIQAGGKKEARRGRIWGVSGRGGSMTAH